MVSQGTLPNQITPVLQAQDGTFLGTDPNGNMIRFDQSGNIKWSVSGDTPQIATDENGVIGASGTTYDATGNASGQAGSLAMVSWTGNAYTDGPVDQVLTSTLNVADTSFAPQANSNPSKNNASLRRCAPLDPTTASTLGSAFSSLTTLLKTKICAFCISSIFEPLNTSQAEFTVYLQQDHEFCDGTQSSEPGGTIGVNYDTVADYFKVEQQAPDYVIAATALGGGENKRFFIWATGERKRWKTFFSPVNVANQTFSFNESLLFHESLHAFSGLGDGGLVPGLCNVLGATPQTKINVIYPQCWPDTNDITLWIQNNIISPSH
jgi:hypothetical protein